MCSFVRSCLTSTVAAAFCISTRDEREFPWLRVLARLWCCWFLGYRPLWSVYRYLCVSICISLLTVDAERLFICLLAICISSLVKCLCSSFLIGLVFVAVACLEFFIYSRNKPIFRNMSHRHFLLVCDLSFHSLRSVFHRANF